MMIEYIKPLNEKTSILEKICYYHMYVLTSTPIHGIKLSIKNRNFIM